MNNFYKYCLICTLLNQYLKKMCKNLLTYSDYFHTIIIKLNRKKTFIFFLWCKISPFFSREDDIFYGNEDLLNIDWIVAVCIIRKPINNGIGKYFTHEKQLEVFQNNHKKTKFNKNIFFIKIIHIFLHKENW